MEDPLELSIQSMEAVSDEALKEVLKEARLDISDERLGTASSLIAAAYRLGQMSPQEFDSRAPSSAHPNIRSIQQSASMVFVAYTSLVYMRSGVLEHGLGPNCPEALRPWRNAFREVSEGEGETNMGQRLRNAIIHGNFWVEGDGLACGDPTPTGLWSLRMPFPDLRRLVEQIFRLYSVCRS